MAAAVMGCIRVSIDGSSNGYIYAYLWMAAAVMAMYTRIYGGSSNGMYARIYGSSSNGV